MKFSVRRTEDGFFVKTDVQVAFAGALGNPIEMPRTSECQTYEEIDAFILAFPAPIIQILPNGKEKVICE